MTAILGLLLPLLPYILGFAAIVGVIAVHDAKVRSGEAAKWQPKVAACEANTKTATDANVKLKADYDAFAVRHDQMIRTLAEQQRLALKRKNDALVALGLREKAAQGELDGLRAKAAAPPQPTKEAACASAETTLRALAAERLRDAIADQ